MNSEIDKFIELISKWQSRRNYFNTRIVFSLLNFQQRYILYLLIVKGLDILNSRCPGKLNKLQKVLKLSPVIMRIKQIKPIEIQAAQNNQLKCS